MDPQNGCFNGSDHENGQDSLRELLARGSFQIKSFFSENSTKEMGENLKKG